MSAGYIRGKSWRSKNRDEKNRGQYHQVQNVKSARVYVFGQDNVVEDDDTEMEMSDFRSRRGGSGKTAAEPNEPVYFEKQLSKDDTLQSLALQYACPVSELKRINKLIRDQDFFALRFIKVPVKRFGLMSEIIAQEKRNADSARLLSQQNGTIEEFVEDQHLDYDSDSLQDLSDPETQHKVIHTISIQDNLRTQSKEAEDFLRNMDKDLSKIIQPSRRERDSLSEVISVLTNKSIHPLQSQKPKHLNGADYGIRWWTVVGVMVLVALFIPGVYFIYIWFLKS
ncbi:lysM and putative peptidoglycan-binding domain-containing protein 3-like [Gigantopelta aegis]|uniref:lysM and putative peptidoglycan-binding domain-containing protein 3-like n=1 Tax=Gigantopelta aegis TaxID=1735272 RepID=UPI001B88B33B|nr:lysM and putative peptidoglycan-binding domain-containing protein 3-like [Gigantopelta aegis]